MTVTRSLGDPSPIAQQYDSTTYGNQWIPSLSKVIVTWKFNAKNSEFIMMGITSNDDCQSLDFSTKNGSSTYAFTSDGQWSIAEGLHSGDRKQMKFDKDDHISFVLDLINREVLLQVNNQKKNVLWTDVKVGAEIQYKLAVCMVWLKNEITLIDFCKEYS